MWGAGKEMSGVQRREEEEPPMKERGVGGI